MAEPPPGVCPVFLTMTTQEMFKVVSGTDVTEVAPYKRVSVKEIMKDISFRGLISDWEPAKAVISKYRNNDIPQDQLEILVVLDNENVYGQNFYVCFTEEAAEAVISSFTQKNAQQSAEEGGDAAAEEEEEPRPKEILNPDPVNRPWIECEVQVIAVDFRSLPCAAASVPVSLAPLLSRVSDLVPARRRGRRRLQSRRRKSTRPESAMSRCARVHAHARAPIEPHTYPRTHSRLGTLSSTHPALAHPPIPPRLRHTCAPTRVRARTHTHIQGPRLRYSLSRERRLFRRAPTVAAPLSHTPPPCTTRPSPAHARSMLNTPAPAPQIITPRAPQHVPASPRTPSALDRSAGARGLSPSRGGPGKARPAAPATAMA